MSKPKLTPIGVSSISKGMTIYYEYSKIPLSGPYKVTKLWRDHEGLHGMLSRDGNERPFLLADDEDYGSLSVYIAS